MRQLIEALQLSSEAKSPLVVASPTTHLQRRFQVLAHEASLIANPEDEETWLNKATMHYQLDEMEEALYAIQKVWGITKQKQRIVWVRACILCEYAISHGNKPKSMLQEALQLFESMRTSASPSTLEYNIGNVLSALGDHEEAIQHYDRAIASKPPARLGAQIFKNRGTEYYHLGNHRREFASYRKAIKLDPNLWEAFSSMAVTEMHQKKYKQSGEHFGEAFRLNPKLELSSAYLLYSFAYVLAKLNKFEQSLRRANQLLAINPMAEDGLKLKSYLLSRLWRVEERYIQTSIDFFKARLVDNPEDAFAQSELYLLYAAHGRVDLSHQVLEEVMPLPEASPSILYHYAMELEEKAEVDKAIRLLQKASESSQEHQIVHALARLMKQRGDYLSAIEYYRLALEHVSNPVSILSSMSDCYHFLLDYPQCILIEILIIQNDPRNTTAWNNLIYAAEKVGRLFDFGKAVDVKRRLDSRRAVSDNELADVAAELSAKANELFRGSDVI